MKHKDNSSLRTAVKDVVIAAAKLASVEKLNKKWKAEQYSTGCYITDNQGNTVAFIDLDRWDKGESAERRKANARLIAAAPVMLEALKVALELLKASELDMLEKYDDLAFNAVHDGRNQVEIAIAQAEGERETK